MKKYILALQLSVLFVQLYSQNAKFEYYGRWNPTEKKEKISKAKFVNDLTANFWNKFRLYMGDNKEFERQKQICCSQKYFYNCAESRFNNDIVFTSVEISTEKNGKKWSALSLKDELTREQKIILNSLGEGEDIEIDIKFKYRYSENGDLENLNEINAGKLQLTLVPETEAEFKGGGKEFNKYMNEKVVNKVKALGPWEKIKQAEIKFMVNETGKVNDIRISKTTTDKKLDKTILDALSKMPDWNPAKNAKGENVKEEFKIPFGGWGGC